jgi:cell division protein FtsL
LRERRVQAFKQAPWKARLRLTSGSMLPLIALLVVGGMYLAVSARGAKAGREVLALEKQRAQLQRENAEMTSVLAELTSPERMMERALALGFRPARPDEIEYVRVEGPIDKPTFVAPNPPGSMGTGAGQLSPAYTETLGDWLQRSFGFGESQSQ